MSELTPDELFKLMVDVHTPTAPKKPKAFFWSKGGLRKTIKALRKSGVSEARIREFKQKQVTEVM